MNWLKGNWFKVGILIAVFSIAYSFYDSNHTSRIQEQIETEGQVVNNIDIIPPSQALKTSFDEFLRSSAMAGIVEFSCFPTSRFDCDGGSCTPAAPATYFFVDYGTESGTYFRCDAKGCDPYPVEVNPSGEFTQFVPSQGQAMLFKVATGDVLGNKGEFVDIATLGTLAIVSFGKCN